MTVLFRAAAWGWPLACRYRVAEEGDKTRLGLPEVKLGIHPGWGGTVRLPRLIGVPNAFNLILSGRTVSGKAAAKLGIVDVSVPKRHLVAAATYYALQSAKPRITTKLNQLINNKVSRILLSTYLRKKLHEKISPEHYPAPFQVIDNWEQLGVKSHAPMEKREK